MLSKRSISKIPYESLPEKIQDYLREELEIFHDEWEDDLDAETQHLCIQDVSNEMAGRVAASSSSSSASSRSSAAAVSASRGRGTAAAAEEKKQRNTPPLPIIDDVLRHNLFHQMDTKSLAAFASSSRYSRKLAQCVLDQRGVKKLFEHIRDGAIDKVKKMLDTNPRLALVEWKAAKEEEQVFANKAGQLISVEGKTAYEFALGEEDTEIAAELYACIVKVRDQEVANTLFHKQRPSGWEEEEAKQSTPIFTQLDELTQAIRNAQPGDIISSGYPDYRLTVREDSVVGQVLAQFRLRLDAMLKEPVTTGQHFNPNLLLHAFQIYDDHYEDYFGNDWSDPKAMLFWQQAIGYIQRFMPANFVQAFCDGLYSTNEKLQKSVPQGRSLRFEKYDSGRLSWVNSDFYPLTATRLGFDFAFGSAALRRAVRLSLRFAGRSCAAAAAPGISKLMSIKNSRLTELTQHQNQRDEASRSFCAIM